MKNQQPLRLFLVLLISTVYIFSFSQIGANAYQAFSGSKNYFAEGTIIGNLPVGGKTEEEAKTLIEEKISEWFSNTTITVHYLENEKTLDLSYIEIDPKATIQQAQHGVKNLVVAKIKPLNDFLKSLSPSIRLEEFNIKALENEILNSAMILEPGNYQYRVENFYIAASMQEDTLIEQSPIILERPNDEIEAFDGKSLKIEPKSHFSFLNYLKEESMHNLSGQSLNKIASAIYTVILPTNFTVLERHISNTLPAYAVLGFEAKVDVNKNFDLAFSNPNDSEYTIEFAKKDQSLVVSLKGPEFLNEYTIALDEEKTFAPKTIKQFSPQIKSGYTVKSEGKKGSYIKVYRESHDENGALLQRKLIAEDFYAPLHRIEIHALGSDKKAEEEEIPDGGEGPVGEDEQGIRDEESDEEKEPGTEDEGEDNGENKQPGDDGSDSDLWGNPDEKPKR